MSLLRYGAAAAVTVALACGGGDAAREEQEACRPVEGVLAADAGVSGLEGDHTLTMVVASGAHEGHTLQGRLTLLPQPDSLRRYSPGGLEYPDTDVPFYGSADIDLASVGALVLGEITSADPARPGVAVFHRRSQAGESQVTLRLGSNANRRDLIRFDGGYTVLRLTWIDGARFGGAWSSGTTDVAVEGYFCAEPTD